MKKCLLFTLTVLGFTSISHADIRISCDARPLGAILIIHSDGAAIGFVHDNYDAAQKIPTVPLSRSGMDCTAVGTVTGTATECVGTWMHRRIPAKVVFAPDADGNISATFTRLAVHGGETVTIPCKVAEQL